MGTIPKLEFIGRAALSPIMRLFMQTVADMAHTTDWSNVGALVHALFFRMTGEHLVRPDNFVDSQEPTTEPDKKPDNLVN